MRWSTKIAVVAVLGLLSLPTAYTFQQSPVVSGHSTYTNMDGMDPCLAGIVGVVRLRVMWFNDQVLFERAASDGASYVYAIQSGSPDPREQTLVPTGQEYPFTDPNGQDWDVKEYTFELGPSASAGGGGTGGVSTGPNGTTVTPPTAPSETTNTTTGQFYAWVVQTGPTLQDNAATGKPYNFVDLVDTCKFTGQGMDVYHNTTGNGNWTSSWSNDTTQNQHLPSDGNMTATAWSVDLYVGKEPKVAAIQQGNPDFLGVPQ
jgi:hypothetical protein